MSNEKKGSRRQRNREQKEAEVKAEPQTDRDARAARREQRNRSRTIDKHLLVSPERVQAAQRGLPFAEQHPTVKKKVVKKKKSAIGDKLVQGAVRKKKSVAKAALVRGAAKKRKKQPPLAPKKKVVVKRKPAPPPQKRKKITVIGIVEPLIAKGWKDDRIMAAVVKKIPTSHISYSSMACYRSRMKNK